ncbi:MAG: hypothetical protein ACKPE3_30205 [Sphaerospermopsis kisseleviana]
MALLDAVFKGVGFLASVAGAAVERVGSVVKQWGESLLSNFQVAYGANAEPSNTK